MLVTSKNYTKEHNTKFTLCVVKDLTYQGFREYDLNKGERTPAMLEIKQKTTIGFLILSVQISFLSTLEENQTSHQQKKTATQDQMTVSVMMENRNNIM